MKKKSILMILVVSLFIIMLTPLTFAYTLTTVGGYGPIGWRIHIAAG